MKALIVAAGEGSRLKGVTKGQSKPLIEILGVSIIERIISSSKLSGILEFMIVVGFQRQKIKKHLGVGNKYGVDIKYVENQEWKRGNAHSVLKAKEYLNESFILLMSDLLFDPRILQNLIQKDLSSSVILTVDRRNPMPGDSGVVEIEGYIKKIGKNIREANHTSIGMLLCSPKIFSYLDKAVEKGKEEIDDGIMEAAKARDAQVFDISLLSNDKFEGREGDKPWWIDIDTEEDFKKAEMFIKRNEVMK